MGSHFAPKSPRPSISPASGSAGFLADGPSLDLESGSSLEWKGGRMDRVLRGGAVLALAAGCLMLGIGFVTDMVRLAMANNNAFYVIAFALVAFGVAFAVAEDRRASE